MKQHYKILIPLILITILSSIPAFSLNEIEMWDNWGRTPYFANSMTTSEGYYASSNLTLNFTYSALGTDYQPLVGSVDLNDAGNDYIIMQTTNYLNVITKLGVIKAQKLLNLNGQPSLLLHTDLNNDSVVIAGETYIVAHDNYSLILLGMNDTVISVYQNITYSNITFENNGINCYYHSGAGTDICFIKYLRFNNATYGTRTNGGILRLTLSESSNNTLSVETNFADLNNTIVTIPSIADMDNNGVMDAAFWSDYNSDANYGMSVFESGLSRILYVDNIFGTSPITPTDTVGFNNPLMYDFDGGYKEIFATNSLTGAGGAAAYMYCYTIAGLPCAGFPKTLASTGALTSPSYYAGHSNPAIAEINSTEVICASGHAYSASGGGYGNDQANIYCFDTLGTIISMTCSMSYTGGGGTKCWFEGNWGTTSSKRHLAAVDLTNDGNDDIILTKNRNDDTAIYDVYKNVRNFTFTTSQNKYFIPVDLNDDLFIDFIGTTSTDLIIYSSAGSTNEAPQLSGHFGYSYDNPVCNDSTLTFTATELTSYTQPLLEGYDTERIAVDCYDNGNYIFGNYHLNNPYVDCYYNVTGNYLVNICIQDLINNDTYAECEERLIQVVKGTPGITCNIAGSGESPGAGTNGTSTAETQTNEALEETFGVLFGTGSSSDKMRLLIGLALVIGIVVMAAQAGVSSGFALVAVGIIALVMVTFIGLVSAFVLIIIVATLLLFAIIGKAVMGV